MAATTTRLSSTLVIKNKAEAKAFMESYKKYRGDWGNGGFTGNHGKNKCCNSKNTQNQEQNIFKIV